MSARPIGADTDFAVAWAPVTAPAAGFVLPGWDDSPTPPSRGASADGRAKRWLLWAGLFVLAVAGGLIAYSGLAKPGEMQQAPVPDTDVVVSAASPVRGADGISPVIAGQSGQEMTVGAMEPLHFFIPELGIYSQIVPTEAFEPSHYENFDTLTVPDDTQKVAWYGNGGEVANNDPDSAGTTLFASHVTGRQGNQWGVLRPLYTLDGGEVIYTTDATGKVAAWKVTQVFTKMHTDFPEDFWDDGGTRQLVLTTCGDYSAVKGYYLKNVFVVSSPVDPQTLEPFVAADEAGLTDEVSPALVTEVD